MKQAPEIYDRVAMANALSPIIRSVWTGTTVEIAMNRAMELIDKLAEEIANGKETDRPDAGLHPRD